MLSKIEFWVFLFLLFKASPLTTGNRINEWIIWNVGQGQWVSHIQNGSCRHYDVGGEPGAFQSSIQTLQKLCLQNENQIAISHWDFDHYSQIFLLAKSIPNLCWISKPTWIENKKSVRAVRLLNIPNCASEANIKQWRPQQYQNSNESSAVFIDESFLVPGDSPTRQEHHWTHELKGLDQVEVLVLGHHGSQTSTGSQLLRALPKIKMAISSARYRKYRHPHYLTLKRLDQFHIPTLRTEDWGHLHLN